MRSILCDDSVKIHVSLKDLATMCDLFCIADLSDGTSSELIGWCNNKIRELKYSNSESIEFRVEL